MTTLVTGATGYIGRRLVQRLCDAGDDVVALTRSADAPLPAGARLALGDIEDPESLRCAAASCAKTIHLAALITFDPKERDALFRANVDGTRNVLAAARNAKHQRIVVVSSACTLGLSDDADTELDERAVPPAQLVARSPYMASKLGCEDAALTFADDLDVVIVNPTTIYGPGDASLNSGHLIKQVATMPALPVPPGGSNVVDIDDVVEGLIAAMDRGVPAQRYVLGGDNLPFSAVFDVVRQTINRRPLLLPVPRWSRPAFALVARAIAPLTGGRFLTSQMVDDLFSFKFYSSAKAERELNWRRRFRFAQSVERAWSYYLGRGLLS